MDMEVNEVVELSRPSHRNPPPSSEIGVKIQMIAVYGDEVDPPSSSQIGMKIQMITVDDDEVDPPLAPSPSQQIGMKVQMITVDGDEADPPLASSSSSSLSEIGVNIQMIAVDGDEADPPLASSSSEIGVNIQMIAVDGDEAYPPLPTQSSSEIGANVQMIAFAGDAASSVLEPSSEIGIDIRLPDSGGEADRDAPLPRQVQRFMHYRIYASIIAILGTIIHVLAGMMEPTSHNKILIGVSMVSLGGNVGASTWVVFYGGDLPNDDWKNISFKIIFVFTGVFTLYAAFSTVATHLFTLQGIVLCSIVAVGIGHDDILNGLCKTFIASIKYATQKIRELIA